MTDHVKLAHHKNETRDYQRAKRLRRNAPPAEQILWSALRLATKDKNYRFRRQHPIQPYIVDFVCLKLRVIIELDGASHDSRIQYDACREKYLRKSGYEVFRFTNEDVYSNCQGVVLTILERCSTLQIS